MPEKTNPISSAMAGSSARADPEARAIFCARGGYGTMRLLPELEPGPLLARPKLLVGFSDVTAIHAVLNRAGLATVQGEVEETRRRRRDTTKHDLLGKIRGLFGLGD